MAKFGIALCLFICLAFVHSGYAMKCYACDSKIKSECNNPFQKDKIPLNECAAPASGDEATCLKITTEDGADMKIKRHCFNYPKGTKPCDHAAGQVKAGHVKECVTCSEDGCNSAVSIQVSTYAIAAMFFFSLANFYARA